MKKLKLKKLLLHFFVPFLIFFAILQIPVVQQLNTSFISKVIHINYSSKEVENIIFRYHPGDEENVEKLVNEVSSMNDLGDGWFDGATSTELPVYVSISRLRHILLKGANAIFLPNNNIIQIDGTLSEKELMHALSHEYAHFHMIHNMESIGLEITEIPAWFHEGVAEAFAHRFAPLPFVYSMGWWDVVPFSEMEMSGGNRESITERYIMAQFTVEKLLKVHGENVISNIIVMTHETGDFSQSFFSITGEPLEEYHEWLKVDNDFFEEINKHRNDGTSIEVKQDLLNYHAEKGPYYYRADNVYTYLQEIYIEEKNWDKAIEMVVNRSYYMEDPWMWKEASEYAIELDDYQLALSYAQKALDSADDHEHEHHDRDYFESWLEKFKK